jgi:tetratricopeptide (TPR) repeat protein
VYNTTVKRAILVICLIAIGCLAASSARAAGDVANGASAALAQPINVTVNLPPLPAPAAPAVENKDGYNSALVTWLGAIVASLSILVVVLLAMGYMNTREWQRQADEMRKEVDGAKSTHENMQRELEEVRKKVAEIERLHVEAKSDTDSIHEMLGAVRERSLSETPTGEEEKKYREVSERTRDKGMLAGLSAEEYMKLGTAHFFSKRFDEALAAYEKAIALKPDHPDAWYKKGLVLVMLGRHDEALAAYEKGIALKPDHPDVWFSKGMSLYALGRHDEALAAYEKAIEFEPDDSAAWYARACVYALKGDSRRALDDLRRAIELDTSQKAEAREDEDFASLRDDPEFKRLTE